MTEMVLRICDVEHGACAILAPKTNGVLGRLAMVDVGDASDFEPSRFLRNVIGRTTLDYLFITNADQDHVSDLEGLIQRGISIGVLYRSPHPSPAQLQKIKEEGGNLTADMKRLISMHANYVAPIPVPFDFGMKGIVARRYWNTYAQFQDTNNLSCVVVFEFCGFRIMFPGDLEENGWQALLQRPEFRAELAGLDILVASHHGRDNGYCPEVFDYCRPRTVIMSDKAIKRDTQYMSSVYGQRVAAHHPDGVLVATTMKRRHVLTTRRDGHIEITVHSNGDFTIETEYHG